MLPTGRPGELRAPLRFVRCSSVASRVFRQKSFIRRFGLVVGSFVFSVWIAFASFIDINLPVHNRGCCSPSGYVGSLVGRHEWCAKFLQDLPPNPQLHVRSRKRRLRSLSIDAVVGALAVKFQASRVLIAHFVLMRC